MATLVPIPAHDKHPLAGVVVLKFRQSLSAPCHHPASRLGLRELLAVHQMSRLHLDKPSSMHDIVNMMTKTISTRLTEDELSALDELAESSGLDRSGMTRCLVRRGLKALRLESALASYTQQRVTLSRAAEIAGLPLWDFIAQMNAAGATIHYDVQELEEDLDDES